MPKRLADNQLLLFQSQKKAKVTATGKPICDRCHKVIYEHDFSERINDRHRHVKCWPAYMAAFRAWCAASDSLRRKKKLFYDALDKFHSEKQHLKDKEYIMKQINCVSKGVREALLHRDRAQPTICLALALVKRA